MMVRRFVEVGVGLEMYRWITVLLHVFFLTIMLHVFLFFYFSSLISFFSLFSLHRGELVPEWWDSFILLLLFLFFEVCTIEWDLQLNFLPARLRYYRLKTSSSRGKWRRSSQQSWFLSWLHCPTPPQLSTSLQHFYLDGVFRGFFS